MTTEPADPRPDLLGRTSARLLTEGVGRLDRLAALRLLAVLDASTDAAGNVRRPIDDLAAEFELPLTGVLRSIDHLERAGALRWGAHGIVLVDRDDTVGGLALADFLDDVRAVWDDDMLAPARSAIDDSDGVIIMAPRGRWLARAGAAVAAVAAAVGVLTLAPSQPIAEQHAASPTTNLRSTTTADALSAIGAGGDAPSTTASRQAATARSTKDVRTAVGDDQTGITTVAGDDVIAASRCPTGSPTADLIGGILLIANPSTSDVIVTGLLVDGVATSSRITVPAGKRIEQAVPALSKIVTVDVWQWADPGTARSCGS